MRLPLIIGIGNEYRSDDAVGLLVCRDLLCSGIAQATFIEESGEGAALIEYLKGAEFVVLIDAVCSGSPPGTIHRFEAHLEAIPAQFKHFSSHSFGVAEAIEYSRALGQLPATLIVYGIEGKSFVAGEHLSPEVESSRRVLVDRILAEIKTPWEK